MCSSNHGDHDMGWILWAQRCSLPSKLAAWPLAQVHVMRSKFNLGGPNIVFFSHPLLCHYLSPRLIVTTEAFSRHTRPVITYISLVITFSVGESFHLRCVCEMVSMRRATAWLSAGDEQRDKSQLTSARTLPFFNYAPCSHWCIMWEVRKRKFMATHCGGNRISLVYSIRRSVSAFRRHASAKTRCCLQTYRQTQMWWLWSLWGLEL